MGSKYLDWKSGYIRNNAHTLELNWNIYDWAIPFSIDFTSNYITFIRFLCISLIIMKK